MHPPTTGSPEEECIPPPPNQLAQRPQATARDEVAKKCLWTLRVLLKDDSATWISSEQRDAAVSVLKRNTDVIAMLKTGGGKSMLAILAAMMEVDKAVVVVLPLKSLMTDWERKLKAMGVPFQVYSPSNKSLKKNVNLILTSADKVKFGTWRKQLAELNESLPVSRLVFDEAHLTLLAEDFRASMRAVQELRQFPDMQLVLLSGTVPPSSVAALKKTFGLMDDAVEVRESSNRPELEYILEAPASSSILEGKTIQIVERERREWSPKDRGLVFVTYMEDGQCLADKVRREQISIRVY